MVLGMQAGLSRAEGCCGGKENKKNAQVGWQFPVEAQVRPRRVW